MNYRNIYESLIEKARSRESLNEYTESHHIFPDALGGSDHPDNLVELTAREYFIAHQLLAKIFGGGMYHAAHMMSNMKRYSSRKYEWLRKRHAERLTVIFSGRKLSEEHKEKLRGIIRSDETKQKLSNIAKNRSKEHKEKIVKSRRKNGSYTYTKEQKEKISIRVAGEGNPMYGKTHTEDARKKIADANKQKIQCPHCSKIGGIAIMKR